MVIAYSVFAIFGLLALFGEQETKERRATIRCLFSILVPPSNLTLNKQEQFTPMRREPSEQLALSVEFWRIRIERTRAESSISKKYEWELRGSR
jgi:hypothetical protein